MSVAADHGAWNVADAPEHCGDERLEPGHQSHQRIDSPGIASATMTPPTAASADPSAKVKAIT